MPFILLTKIKCIFFFLPNGQSKWRNGVMCIIGRLFFGCCLTQGEEASLWQTHDSPWSARRLTGLLWSNALWVKGIFFYFVQFFSQGEEINCIYCERGISSRILCLENSVLMEIKSNVKWNQWSVKEYKPKKYQLLVPVVPTVDKESEVLVSNVLRGSFP